jgi:hypothetical protein
MGGLRLNGVTRQRVTRGTLRRVWPYARRYRLTLAVLLAMTSMDAGDHGGEPANPGPDSR